MGPVIAAGGTRNLINGDPQNPQGDPNLPNGTLICRQCSSQMGPYLAEGPMFTGRVFRFITRPGRLHLPSVSIRRSCSKRVLGDGRYRTQVLLGFAAARGCAPSPWTRWR